MFVRRLVRKLGYVIVGLSDVGKRAAPDERAAALDLTGDRDIEWSWVAAHVPDNPGAVLDFGCGESALGLIAAMKGGDVTGFDRQQVRRPYGSPNLRLETGDILNSDFTDKHFDVIINCSSIEHVGLAGRYGSTDAADGDLIAMERLRRVLKAPGGTMILTVPVGKDSVFKPLHRVYGVRRLKLLLGGYTVVKKEFWSKRSSLPVWTQVSEGEAVDVQPSESFYALGLFVLRPDVSALDA